MSGPPAGAEGANGPDHPLIAVTLGDPRSIGPEVTLSALRRPGLGDSARWIVVGFEGWPVPPGCRLESVGRWDGTGGDLEAGRLSRRSIERAVDLVETGQADGIVTGPVSKRALTAAGWGFPGHTEWLRERTGAGEVTMVMAAETTPLGGALRVGLLTGHVPLREVPDRITLDLVERKVRVAATALREWWGIRPPRICLAGLNPHASEGGLFGDEEARVLEPAAVRLAGEKGLAMAGVVPADSAFRRCVDGEVDLVMAPYHDVGLAVLKTVARDAGVNVTAGLPFPRTAPDHGTAFDIAGRGIADPGATAAALELCARFCRAAARAA